MSFSKRIKLTAQFAYEACAEGHPEVLGWHAEPDAVKESWYKAANLWEKAEAKAAREILLPKKGKPHAK